MKKLYTPNCHNQKVVYHLHILTSHNSYILILIVSIGWVYYVHSLMDIPILISYIFHAPLHIKKFQLTTQLMNSNFLFLILFLARAPFLGFSCYLIKHKEQVPRVVSYNQVSARCFQLDWVPEFGHILELETINCIFNWNIRCAEEIGTRNRNVYLWLP